jgi:hypothetical protein
MNCTACKSEMVRVDYLGEYFCPKCNKCKNCHKNPAVIDKFYGVLTCKECQRELRKKAGSESRYFSMTNKMREYFATPFWKVMGQKPKKEDILKEREMKRRGITYYDLQRQRNMARHFNSSHLVNKLERGELYGESDVNYRK